MSDNNFNVLDMAQDYANSQGMEIDDLFVKSSPTPADESDNDEPGMITPVRRKEKKAWVPDESLTEGMDELTQGGGVVYNSDEVRMEDESPLVNILDDDAQKEAVEAMDELHRKEYNISMAKKRHGIVNFQIPINNALGGSYQVRIMNSAGDTNYERAQAGLDEVFNEIKATYPEWIRDWAEDTQSPVQQSQPQDIQTGDKIINIPESKSKSGDDQPLESAVEQSDEIDETKIIVDKSQLREISWSPEDVEKIRRSRSVELNIVETEPVAFSEIQDVPDNMVDAVISQYVRKANDVTASLPASKYRCTFTGLTYPEVIDLSNATEMNNIDGERKKWSLCFEHMRNQSIGPWQTYKWYIDPNTNKKVRIDVDAAAPDEIKPEDIHFVSKFDDFLMKTSFMDLEFMLWKILCATAMDSEIISIDCHAKLSSGATCDHNYDWLYRPVDLLQTDSIDPAVLVDMQMAGEADTKDKIMEIYMSSMLQKHSTVKLPHCGLTIVFGHISAYDYLNSVYGKMAELRDSEADDPTIQSRGLNYATLTVIKAILVPANGGFQRITGADNLVKIINNMDEIDWQALGELVRISMEPYQLRFVLRDIICPKCKNRSSIPIESMTQLLFIVARSLSSVSVTFKTT